MPQANTLIGSGPTTVKKFVLSDGGAFTISPGMTILHSEVVVNSGNDEVLEIWLSVPTVPELDTSTAQGPRTIYTNTTVYEEPTTEPSINPRGPEEQDDDEFYY